MKEAVISQYSPCRGHTIQSHVIRYHTLSVAVGGSSTRCEIQICLSQHSAFTYGISDRAMKGQTASYEETEAPSQKLQ